jgi:transcriptional regulator NrdR family protein
MRCPRCQQPTHVINTRWKGYIVRRERGCGQVKGGKTTGENCGLRFWSMEMPVGYKAEIEVKLTPKGFETEVKR